MKTVVQALIIVLFLDCLVFLSQTAMIQINPSASQFFDYEGSNLAEFDTGDEDYVLDQDVSDDIPETGNPVAANIGSNVFTDVYSTLKNWILNLPGAKYVTMVIGAVPTWLKYLGLPAEVSFALGFIWHGLAMVLVIMWLK